MLTSKQLQTLHKGLVSAFKDREVELERLLRVGIGVPLDRLVSPGPVSGQLFEVVQAAERAGWTTELVRAAFEARPEDPLLESVYRALGLGASVSVQHARPGAAADPAPGGPSLEGVGLASLPPSAPKGGAFGSIISDSLVSGGGAFVDPTRWREQLAMIEAQVCRIEIGGGSRATGFLVGPDLVLVAHHVLRDVIDGREDAGAVRLRFDYRVLPSGSVTEGLIVRLRADDWLVAFSPNEQAPGGPATPDADALDFALVRLADPIGLAPVDRTSERGAARGWLRVPESGPTIARGMLLIIAQYALGGPLRIAVDADAVLGVSDDGTRFQYRTNTVAGSSGAPCFDADWRLVGMHHSRLRGDEGGATSGEGIPIAAIRSHLERAGLAALLGGEAPAAAPPPPVDPGGGAQPPQPAPVRHDDDPQKGRWGGHAERSGRRLAAEIRSVGRWTFIFDATVASTDGTPLTSPVLFHLHDSYPKSVIWIRKVRGERTAVLEDVSSYGVYTIGAQVLDAGGQWVGLELDLAGLPELPSRFLSR